MIILIDPKAEEKELSLLIQKLKDFGARNLFINENDGKKYIQLTGRLEIKKLKEEIKLFDCIVDILPPETSYYFVSRKYKNEKTVVDFDGIEIGGKEIGFIAGPCAVESKEQIFQVAEELHRLGIKFIRGGAVKPRTSPYTFKGLGLEALQYLRAAANKYGLKVVSEVIDNELFEEIIAYVDIVQVGTRNMQNFSLLGKLGKIDKPVLLKRGISATIDEWLLAAEYIAAEGNENIILCERGIRTFENITRATLDLSSIPILKERTHLPIIVDPSHASGNRLYIKDLTLAAIAAGADGVMLEAHPNPEEALSDGPQSIYLSDLEKVYLKSKGVWNIINN